MFIAVVFPLADFRDLHPAGAGRLERPRWGEANPQAEFARGFGAIHIRTKSGNGFVGESYYADCNKAIKYPRQIFLGVDQGQKEKILAYPVYRRLYFDGKMSGRIELGFRLNEGTVNYFEDMAAFNKKDRLAYDVSGIAKQILDKEIRIHLLDGRTILNIPSRATESLRDAYILSTTKNSSSHQYDMVSVGSQYVSVGMPFVVIRSGSETPLGPVRQKRSLLDREFKMFLTRSGTQG